MRQRGAIAEIMGRAGRTESGGDEADLAESLHELLIQLHTECTPRHDHVIHEHLSQEYVNLQRSGSREG